MERGKINEENIINVYNNKKYRDLTQFQKNIIKELFKNVKDDDLITSDICNRFSKPDIYFEINNERKNISIKSGRSDSMHFESLKSFILFLRGLGVSKETQKTIILFHFGDGTLDGTGANRLNFEKIIAEYSEHIRKANNEINSPLIVLEALNRFVFNGIEARKVYTDYIYFGDEDYGVLCSKEKLINFVLSKKYYHIKTLHFGPLTVQPYLRDVERKSRNTYKRYIVQIKWHYLLSDMQRINSINDDINN